MWLLLSLATAAVAAPEPPLFNEQGYRSARYRAPVPAAAPGATGLDAAGLRALLAQRSVALVDVYAAVRSPSPQQLESVWLVPRPRDSLPGAVWLPNVGYAELDPRLDAYFRENLQRLTGGDYNHPVVLFCVTDCWMSWNAVRRARDYGYTQLYWFSGGTDAWQAEGLPLQPVQAEPLFE